MTPPMSLMSRLFPFLRRERSAAQGAAGGTAPATAGRRLAVIVGMHRSGTSMLARLLAAQGLHMGDRLLNEAQPDNAYGYWEHADIVAIQEGLLDGMDRTWHGPKGALPLPTGWMDRPEVRVAKERLSAIVAAEVTAAPSLWGFKDPRTVRLLPLWREIFRELDLRPVYVLAVREPTAVAASLIRRNGMTAEYAESLWALHNLDAVDQLGGEIVAVVDYDRWFDAGQGMAEHLLHILDIGTRPSAEDMAALVDAELRHHRGRAAAARPPVAALYEALTASVPLPPRGIAGHPAVAAARADLAERHGWTVPAA